jgi:hypothetical protein
VRDLWDAKRGEIAPGPGGEAAAEGLDTALDSLSAAAERFEAAREEYLRGEVDADRSDRANAELRAVERELTREAGLVGRPWNRNLVFTTDDRNGYATLDLPSISEALIAGDAARAVREVDDFATRIRAAADRLDAAAGALAP